MRLNTRNLTWLIFTKTMRVTATSKLLKATESINCHPGGAITPSIITRQAAGFLACFPRRLFIFQAVSGQPSAFGCENT